MSFINNNCHNYNLFSIILLHLRETRMHTNHVDFEPIYIETYRKSSMPLHFRVFWKEALLTCYYRWAKV